MIPNLAPVLFIGGVLGWFKLPLDSITMTVMPMILGIAVLLHSGFSRAKALLFNVLASLTTVVGGLLAYYALSEVMSIIPYVLAVAASSFIYIAVADLIPGLHKETRMSATTAQIFLIVAGVVVIYIAHSQLH